MKNALILHGIGNNSQGNWFPWLKTELEDRNWKVWVPDLPQPDRPNIERCRELISDNDWELNDESILIGHSSGAVTILGLLQRLPENVKVDTCILVSSFKDNLGYETLDDLFKEPFDFTEIKKHAQRFIFVHSDNDPYCSLKHAEYLSEMVNGKLIIKKGQGHFNLEKGPEYKKIPLILEILES